MKVTIVFFLLYGCFLVNGFDFEGAQYTHSYIPDIKKGPSGSLFQSYVDHVDYEPYSWKRKGNVCRIRGTNCMGDCNRSDTRQQRRMKCSYSQCCTGYRTVYRRNGRKKCVRDIGCFPALPQRASVNCQKRRQLELGLTKSVYAPIKPHRYLGGKIPLAQMTLNEASRIASVCTRDRAHLALLHIALTSSSSLQERILANLSGFEDNLPTFNSYVAAFKQMRNTVKALKSTYGSFYAVSDKRFLNKLTSPQFWLSDKYFTQQRLAGGNPYILRRVETKKRKSETMSLAQFLNDVNPSIREVVQNKLKMSLEQAVKEDLIFVADHEEMRGWVAIEDFPSIKGMRSIRNASSPIAIFASVPSSGGWWVTYKFEIIGIQTNTGKANKLVTPGNTYEWALAKLEFQMVDNIYTTVIEHMFENHFRMEQYCLASKRAISHLHPLYRIFEAHCRGIFLINRAANLRLLKEKSGIDLLTSPRTEQMIKFAEKRIKKWTYGSGNIITSMKNRGVMYPGTIPYYPARDDGEMIMDAIERYVEDVVDEVYMCDSDVADDSEMQRLANSLSADGIPASKDDLKGTIVGMPPHFKSKSNATEFLVTFLGMTVRQNSITSSFLDFASNAYLMPTKLHNPLPGITLTKPSDVIHHLPNSITTAAQAALAITMGTLHLDSLLDYSALMPTRDLRKTTRYHRDQLRRLGRDIADKNKQRRRDGNLPYFYFLPQNMVNSIST